MHDDPSPSSNPAKDAKEGTLSALTALADIGPNGARNAYKWLSAALDFGHKASQQEIEDLYEWSDLSRDDDQYESAAAHWELAIAYLEGAQGLPRNLKLAQKHLQEAFKRHKTLEEICSGTGESYEIKPLLDRLDQEACRVLRDAVGE